MDKANCRFYVSGGVLPNFEPVIWLSVKDEDAHMLASDVYDAFVLVPLYIAMYYKQDLHIHGPVSKKLYKNVMNYLQRILCDFGDELSCVNVIVDGFKTADGNPDIVGAGISCGIDSLSTIYDWRIKENDPDYRINALFFFNNGWHGDCRNPDTKKLFLDRYNQCKPAADDLGLPLHLVDSNFSAFVFGVYGLKYVVGRIGHFANYSCILGLQRGIRRYYSSSTFSYTEIMKYGMGCRGDDFAEFSESYSVPLVSSEKAEIVVDGCQYERTKKTENISGWEIARKYLNVCGLNSYDSVTAHNCSKCDKCMRTLTALEAIGKLDDFSGVFDIETYRRLSYSLAKAIKL